MTGPTIAYWLQRRGVSLITARKCAFTVGALLMTCMLFVAKVQARTSRIALLCLGGFAHQTLSITVITMSSDLFRKNEVATVAGIAGFCGNSGVLVFTLVVGGLVKVVGYDPFFVALALFDILGAIWLWSVVRDALGRHDAPEGRQMIRNPILPGFNPDPSIVRVGDDYYIATSTFEWFPGRADPSFARSRELAAADAAAAAREPAQHARRSRLLRRLGAVPHLQPMGCSG